MQNPEQSGAKDEIGSGDILREEPPPFGHGGGTNPIHEYLRKIERALKRGDSTEHTHRPALKELLEALNDKIIATNEPKRSACGAPDYVVSRKRDHLSVGYVVAHFKIGLALAAMDEEPLSHQQWSYEPHAQ